jgi:hypothetical protein
MNSFAGSLTALFVAGMVGGYAGLYLLGPTEERQPTAKVAAAPIPDPAPVPCSMQAWPNADRKCLQWTAPRTEATDAKTNGAKIDAAKTNGAKAVPQTPVAVAPSSDQRAASPAQPSTVGTGQPSTVGTGQPSTVGMSSESRPAPAPAAAAPQPSVEAPRDAATEPTRQSEPAVAPAKSQSSKSRTAAHNRGKALAVVRGFGDNLNDVPLNAYASDGAPRRSVSRQSSSQDRYYAQRPRGWWW